MNKAFQQQLRKAKLRLLKMHYESHCGHLGSNFSCIDILMTLHHCVMKPNDRFLLSKGHSAGALYVTLWSQGKLDESDLQSFSRDNTLFPGHPSGSGIPDLLFSTGSLGHGPSLAAGLALAAKHGATGRHIYCLCSDGEWQEGSCWEALTFALHQQLSNLTFMIDQNGWQGFGKTGDVVSCSDLAPRIEAFGAHVRSVDGHNTSEIDRALRNPHANKSNVVLFNTIKGKDLHFEGTLESHYLPLSEEQYRTAYSKLSSRVET